MPISDELRDKLKGKLNPEHVSKRKLYGNSGAELSYIEGWHAIAEANELFGFDGWSSETVELKEIFTDYNPDQKGNVRCSFLAKCKITALGVIREGTGYGSGIAKSMGDAMESATKEAETDARKRALMTFGNKFGLALYDKTQANVGYDEGDKPSGAYAPKAGGGYKDEKGFSGGKMNSAGKKRALEDLRADLDDTGTNLALDNLYRSWAKTLDSWKDSGEDIETSWREIAMGLFTAKRKEINEPHVLEAG